MSRPRKCRKVCNIPRYQEFAPLNAQDDRQKIVMTVDEYETIRLIDRENLSQEDCGKQMNIARTTVQQIYASARKKLADTLVEGLPLVIEGGDYQLCNGETSFCGCGRHCHKHALLNCLPDLLTINEEE